MNKAANLQYQRVVALKKNPETISDLIQKLLGMRCNVRKRLPFTLIPLMVTLETNWIKINENSVPLVGIYNLNSFLEELKVNLEYFINNRYCEMDNSAFNSRVRKDYQNHIISKSLFGPNRSKI